MRSLILLLAFLIAFQPVGWSAASTDFDPTNESVAYGDIPALSDSTTVSCSAWVKWDAKTADYMVISNRNTLSAAEGMELFFDDVGFGSGRTDTYSINVDGGTPGIQLEGATNAGNSGVWQNPSFTAEAGSSTGLRLYVNNSEDANSPASLASHTHLGNSDQPWTVGLQANGIARDADGRIGYLQCWSRVLSQVELMESSLKPGMIATSLELFDPGWDGSGTHIDLSGNGRNGTGTGVADSNDGPPVMFGGGLPL